MNIFMFLKWAVVSHEAGQSNAVLSRKSGKRIETVTHHKDLNMMTSALVFSLTCLFWGKLCFYGSSIFFSMLLIQMCLC